MEQALTLSQFGLWVFALVQFVLYGVFLRMVGRFLKEVRLRPPTVQRASLTVSEAAPAFRAVDQMGRTVEIGPAQERPVLMLFVLHTCTICHQILPRLQEIKARYPRLDLIVIASEEGEGEDGAIPEDVSFIRSNAIRKQYFVTYVPAMVMLSRNRRVLGTARAVSLGDFENRLEQYAKTAGH
jgi:hypothetical protein